MRKGSRVVHGTGCRAMTGVAPAWKAASRPSQRRRCHRYGAGRGQGPLLPAGRESACRRASSVPCAHAAAPSGPRPTRRPGHAVDKHLFGKKKKKGKRERKESGGAHAAAPPGLRDGKAGGWPGVGKLAPRGFQSAIDTSRCAAAGPACGRARIRDRAADVRRVSGNLWDKTWRSSS